MPSALIGFCVGVVSVAWLPLSLKLLSIAALSLGFICFVPIAFKDRCNFTFLLCGVSLGMLYACGVGNYNLQHRLKDCGTGALITAFVRISGSPIVQGDRQSFDAVVISAIQPGSVKPLLLDKEIKGKTGCDSVLHLRKLRLSWYQGPQLHDQQYWHVEIKLKAPRGFQNAGGFDYEAWMFYSRFDASGIVKSGTPHLNGSEPFRSASPDLAVLARQFFLQRDLAQKGVMLALVTGDNKAIKPSLWGILRASGTIHLIVISGLHVGLIAALGFFVGQGFVRLFPPLMIRMRARLPGVLGGLVCSYLYCGLSGWNLPAQRAFTTLIIIAFFYFLNRRLHSGNCLLVVVALLLFIDPLSPLSSGFWLSFGAVAVLLYYFVPRSAFDGGAVKGDIPLNRKFLILASVRKVALGLVRMQWVLFVGMIPLMGIWLGHTSLVAPIGNMLAVPVISWLVVPSSMTSFLLSRVCESFAYQLQTFTSNVLEHLFAILDALNQLAEGINLGYSQAGAMHSTSVFAWVLTAFSATLLISPLNLKTRLLVASGLLIPFVGNVSKPEEGEFRLTVLDVGQGSAYIVETSEHRLLYDTAALTRTGFNLGDVVVIPNLLRSGINNLDVVVLSHADMDHVGGYDAISQKFDIGITYHGSPMTGIEGERCMAGQFWEWNGVRFEFVHPSSIRELSRNDQSCVLLVSNFKHSILLTGDISKKIELQIRQQLHPLSVLVVAHHGSRTSSSQEFIRRVQPAISIISAGYANQFRHPHEDVLARLNRYSQLVLVTGDVGTVTWASQYPDEVVSARSLPAPYWRAKELSRD